MITDTTDSVRRALRLADLGLPAACRGYILTRAAAAPIEIHPALLALDAERWSDWAYSRLMREATYRDLLGRKEEAHTLRLAAGDAEARAYGDEPLAPEPPLPSLARRVSAPYLRGPLDLPAYASHLLETAAFWDGEGDPAFLFACEHDLRGMLVARGLAGARLHCFPWLKASRADQETMRSIVEEVQEDPNGWFERSLEAAARRERGR